MVGGGWVMAQGLSWCASTMHHVGFSAHGAFRLTAQRLLLSLILMLE